MKHETVGYLCHHYNGTNFTHCCCQKKERKTFAASAHREHSARYIKGENWRFAPALDSRVSSTLSYQACVPIEGKILISSIFSLGMMSYILSTLAESRFESSDETA
jgi:hypothetical protein